MTMSSEPGHNLNASSHTEWGFTIIMTGLIDFFEGEKFGAGIEVMFGSLAEAAGLGD